MNNSVLNYVENIIHVHAPFSQDMPFKYIQPNAVVELFDITFLMIGVICSIKYSVICTVFTENNNNGIKLHFLKNDIDIVIEL